MSVNTPLVSVVIIFLNAERFFIDAIDSVFAQTYERWELILVDDGSTDGSTEIARRFANEHSARVRYMEHLGHQNLGMSASRNAGIRAGKGSLIALLDSDDVWLPQKLQEQVAIFAEHSDAKMVYGNSLFWNSWNGNRKQEDDQLHPGTNVDRMFYPPELLLLYFQPAKAALPVPSDLIFLREMALTRGGFEETFRSMYEEHPFLLKAFAFEPVFVSSRCWTRYRQHEQSTMAMSRESNSNDPLIALIQWTEDFLRSQGFRGTDVWRAMKRSRFRFRHPLLFRLAGRIRRLRGMPGAQSS